MANSNIVKFKDEKGNEYSYLYIDLMSGIFYVRIRVGTKIRVASLETIVLNEAKARIKQKIVELHKKKDEPPPPENVLVVDYYEKMMKIKEEQGVKEQTQRRIRTIWEKSLKTFWELMDVNDVNQQQVTLFNEWHREHRMGVQFVNVYKYLGNIFNLMENDGIFARNKIQKPVLELTRTEKRHHAKQKGRYITEEEIIEVIKNSDPVTKLLTMIAYSTGMRKMEMGALELSRLKLHKDYYVFVLDTDDTKTGLARVVPMPVRLTELIREQINKLSNYLFYMKTDPSRPMSSQLIDKGWIKAKELAQIEGRMRFHDLRHTAATNMAKSGINPIIAVTILGMDFKTYQKTYLKLSVDDLIVASETNFARLEGLNV